MKTETKIEYTPGPWDYKLLELTDGVNEDGQYINPHTITDYYTIVAGEGFWRQDENSLGFGLTGYMSEANARLIAAAPDMLEALHQVIRHGLIEQEGYESTLKLVWDAISKARGE